jgi:hypothetical protein
MKKLLLIVTCLGLIACYVFAVSTSEKYQLDNFKVSTLKGLSGVALTIKIVRDNPQTLELLKEVDLQRDIEFALQKGGVQILRPTSEVGLYVVIIKVSGGGPDALNLAIDVQSTLRQFVYLQRDSNIKTEAQTWPATGQSRFGLVSIAQAQAMITKSVNDQAASFAEDFKAANTKSATTENAEKK